MGALRARVEHGRLVLDEATTLPQGTVVDLVADHYHAYYVASGEQVRVIAVWHAQRGVGPPLRT